MGVFCLSADENQSDVCEAERFSEEIFLHFTFTLIG